MHESEFQLQGNQRFFFLDASRPLLTPSRLSRSALIWRKIKENLWEKSKEEKNQGKPLGPGYGHLNGKSEAQGAHRAGIKMQLFGSWFNNGFPFQVIQ